MSTWGVTGATGFIGRHLCRALLEQGERVVALLRPGSPSLAGVAAGVEARAVELADETALAHALTGVEVCIHLAVPRRQVLGAGRGLQLDGLRRGSRSLLVDAVHHLLEAGARTGLRRLVLPSSTAVYGHRWRVVVPATPPRPDTPYGRDRLAGDTAALARGPGLGIEVVVARLSEVFGPGSRAQGPLFQAIAGGGFRVPGDGRHPHQLVAVDDAVRALVSCGRTPAVNEPILISGPRITLRQWLDAIGAAAGTGVRYFAAAGPPGRVLLRLASVLPITIGGSRRLNWDYLLRPRAYDLIRSREVLGDYQQADLAQGVGATLEWYRGRAFGH